MLLEHWQGIRLVEIERPDQVSPDMVGDTLTRLLNRHVSMELVAREDWESAFRSAGMKNPAPRILMLDAFNDGWIEFEAGQDGSRKTKTYLAEALGQLVERQPSSGSTPK